jgi:hypothetical protein
MSEPLNFVTKLVGDRVTVCVPEGPFCEDDFLVTWCRSMFAGSPGWAYDRWWQEVPEPLTLHLDYWLEPGEKNDMWVLRALCKKDTEDMANRELWGRIWEPGFDIPLGSRPTRALLNTNFYGDAETGLKLRASLTVFFAHNVFSLLDEVLT